MGNKLKVGFIGLGLMGLPMARNILKNKFPLVVYNRTPSKTSSLKKLGAKVASSPSELASEVDILITMVTGPKDVEKVLLGKGGVIEGAKKSLVIIDMSTIGPKAARELNSTLKLQKHHFLDAPVTGSTVRAISGELTIFVGGNKNAYLKVKPVLKALGKDIYHMGDVGMGQAIKLVNNLLVGTTLAAISEGFLLAEKEGLTRKQVVETLENVPAVSGMMRMKMPNYLKDKYPVAFSVANMSKDLDLALDEKGDLPLLKLTSSLYKKAIKMGLANEDNSAIIKVMNKA